MLTTVTFGYMARAAVAMNPIYQRPIRRGFALYKCPINFSDTAHPKLLGQPIRRFGGQRKHYDTRCRSIKPMDKSQINIAGLVELISYVLPAIVKKRRVAGMIALHQHTRRFTYDEEMIISIKDFQ